MATMFSDYLHRGSYHHESPCYTDPQWQCRRRKVSYSVPSNPVMVPSPARMEGCKSQERFHVHSSVGDTCCSFKKHEGSKDKGKILELWNSQCERVRGAGSEKHISSVDAAKDQHKEEFKLPHEEDGDLLFEMEMSS